MFLLYCGLFVILFASVLAQSGSKNLVYLLIYAGSLLVSYGLFLRLFRFPIGASQDAGGDDRFLRRADPIADGLLTACAVFIGLHFAYLGHVPLLAGIQSNDYYDIMRVRQSVFYEAPALFRYVPNMIVKSVLPFLLLYYSVIGRKSLFWITVLLGTFYGLSLLNKMFVVILFAPLMLHLLFTRRFFRAVGISFIPVAALALLVFVQNPHVRPEAWTLREKATAAGKPLVVQEYVERKTTKDLSVNNVKSPSYPMRQFVETIYLRIFVVPGEVVTAWFTNIPGKLPFANGCGYRLVAAMRGCEFMFYPSLVHDIENPVLVAEGVHGTMTAASFMEDYANFGAKGLVLSGVLLAFVLTLVARLFAGNWRWALILNFIPISMMLELPLTTVLLTGGWALTLVLYYVFRARLKEADANADRTRVK